MRYFVEEGKSVSTRKRGILGPHEEFKIKYIGDVNDNTKKAVETLFAKGVIYEAEQSKPDKEKALKAKVEKAKKTPAVKSNKAKSDSKSDDKKDN